MSVKAPMFKGTGATGIAAATVNNTPKTGSIILFGRDKDTAPNYRMELVATADNGTDQLIMDIYAVPDGTNVCTFAFFSYQLPKQTSTSRWVRLVRQEEVAFSAGFQVTLRRSGSTTTFIAVTLTATGVYIADITA